MEIKGKIWCLFEQSATFKNEFKKLGYEAFDADIQNNFGETDYVIDLFKDIENGYDGKPSIFDNITKDDLIMAFFPCIYFCEKSALSMTFDYINYKHLTMEEIFDKILERSRNRQYFYELILKLFAIAKTRHLRLVFENPYSTLHYLIAGQNFIQKPSIIDTNRRLRGDYFKKPTSYWFVECEPTKGFTMQISNIKKTIRSSKGSPLGGGTCSEDRSMMSPDYARNFICDFILGKKQNIGQLQLF